MADTHSELSKWYASLYPRHVDLVGDYAGAELFLIEGDSLLLEAFSDPLLDFSATGFQLLHAVYNVEKQLKQLSVRGSKYHVAFFEDRKELCVPGSVEGADRAKYLLAREVVIRHLRKNVGLELTKILAFDDIEDETFLEYLQKSGCYFVLLHDGSGGSVVQQEQNMWQIHFLAQQGFNVALINGLECHDTKIMTTVLEDRVRPKTFKRPKLPKAVVGLEGLSVEDFEETLETLLEIVEAESVKLSERDVVTIIAAHKLLVGGKASQDDLSALLLHTAALEHLPLQARHIKQADGNPAALLEALTTQLLSLLGNSEIIDKLDEESLSCNVADLIDGRLLSALLSEDSHAPASLYTDKRVQERTKSLGNILTELAKVSKLTAAFELQQKLAPATNGTAPAQTNGAQSQVMVLPFSHPVLDAHLKPIHLKVDEADDAGAKIPANIYNELTHWHNANIPLATKGGGHYIKTPDLKANKRNQRFMTEIRDYAASLTNAVGKVLDPEIIVVREKTKASTKPKHAVEAKKPKKEDPKKKVKPPTGKDAALAAAAKSQASRDTRDEKNYFNSWDGECKDFAKTAGPQTRYRKIDKYFNSLQRKVQVVVGAEVALYKMMCLYEACETSIGDPAKEARIPAYFAIIWYLSLSTSQQAAPVTPQVAKVITLLLEQIHLPQLKLNISEADRRLPFKLPSLKGAGAISKTFDHKDATNFQLAHCGPYLDRSFDSQPDDRVPFQPDAWQRKVLDAIDEEKSLLVLAPTSAGKTFISFYAMKQVLESSDDGILVYVAPTKALVNQIAAEVQARFSKNLKQDGRSVWGIHTRDYRINNPTGCQVLVTVPHILQIMLMAPSHAKTDKSWSSLVKRIIFDEVHCIGQEEDGLIWEQLLLMAPCPIIALSATVGNPKALGSWLEDTQKAIGNEFVVVQHKTRHNDLRKFRYQPPDTFEFQPLQPALMIQLPGLDGSPAFGLVHPVSSLIDRTRGIPEDLSMEPRDCLMLFDSMNRHQTKSHPLPKSLSPQKALPAIIKKTDVLIWEEKLKEILKAWISDAQSPFPAVLEELSQTSKPKFRPGIEVASQKDDSVKGRIINHDDNLQTTLPMLSELHAKDALPAIIFNFDRAGCEKIAQKLCDQLKEAEDVYKESAAWRKKVADWEAWKITDEKAAIQRKKTAAASAKAKSKGGDDDDGGSKLDRMIDAAAEGSHPLARFNPDSPVAGYHFVDERKMTNSELDWFCNQLRWRGIAEWLISALRRGVGVHHSGMNRRYRQIVEILFRKGFLRVVIATGTLALGINMPCKTVVFSGDSVFLTALNFRQAAGRAGRRGFDVLGNVVFQGIAANKVSRLLSSRLPDLNGHFPITTSLVLRMFTLLYETRNSKCKYSAKTVNAILSQPRLYLGGEEAKMTVLHHLRFSVEYLRREALLGAEGEPMNFAGLVSHLYYTENSGFALHALLKGGYFHQLCEGIHKNQEKTLRELMVVMCHLFFRTPLRRIDERFAEDVIKTSPSIVILPELPAAAAKVLKDNVNETLEVYRNYVATFVDQHVSGIENSLPFSKLEVGTSEEQTQPAQVKLRSSFVALSGHDDTFTSIHDLCSTVRDGVFLEESVIPYVDVTANSHLLNAWAYDFFKHGDITALAKANKIRKSEVWFKLNDFSMILATIIASMKNFMGMKGEDSVELDDIRGSGDVAEEAAGEKDIAEDEETSEVDEASSDAKGMLKVLMAFELLKKEFDTKFVKIFA